MLICWCYRPTRFTSILGSQLHDHGGAADTRVRTVAAGAILSAMNTDPHRIPAKPTLDGLEDKWTQRWAKERVVQV
jgi:hypothetical protein